MPVPRKIPEPLARRCHARFTNARLPIAQAAMDREFFNKYIDLVIHRFYIFLPGRRGRASVSEWPASSPGNPCAWIQWCESSPVIWYFTLAINYSLFETFCILFNSLLAIFTLSIQITRISARTRLCTQNQIHPTQSNPYVHPLPNPISSSVNQESKCRKSNSSNSDSTRYFIKFCK